MKLLPVYMKWCLALMVAVASFSAHASQQAGQILFARGVVSIIDANESARGARVGNPVFEGERIVTGRNSVVQVHLSDGSMLGLRGNSDYLIETQRYEPEAAETEEEEESVYEQAGQLFSGWMRMVTGAIGKSNPSNVRQSTSVATIGIRGTVYQVIHVPPEGLAGYPDTQPGTYLMLEEGEIVVTGEGGSRTARPGDIIFVPFAGGVPEPAPEYSELFEVEEDVEVYDDDNEYTGEDLQVEIVEDPLNDTLPDTLFPGAPFTRLAMMNAWGIGSTGGAPESEIVLAGSGDSIYPLSAIIDNGEVVTQLDALPDELPVDTGYYQIRGQGEAIKSEVYWGRFDALQHNVDSLTAAQDWHYMLASQTWYDLRDINSSFPAGELFYTYVGGTPLTGDLGGVLLIDAGQAKVNLLTLDMFIELSLSSGEIIDGNGLLTEYTGSGFFLTDGLGANGQIQGGFTGGDLDGMFSAVTVSLGGDEQYKGTALFEQDGGTITTSQLTSISVTGDSLVAQAYRIYGLYPSEDTVTTAGSGESRIVTEVILGEGLGKQTVQRLVGSPAAPLDAGGVQLKDGSYLNWGAWSSSDYEVLYGLSPNLGIASSEWLWLVGDLYLTENVVLPLDGDFLKGAYSYKLAGGTPLYDQFGTSDLTVNGGELVVDFGSNNMAAELLVGFTLLDGSGTVSDFYGAGLAIQNNQGLGPSYAGNLYGGFFGADAVGAGAWLDLNDGSVGQWSGVLAFERGERANEGLLFFSDNGGGFVTRVQDYVGRMTTEGEGNDRKVIGYDFNNVETGLQVDANIGETPVEQGYLAFADGTEVNWGIWSAGTYSVNSSPTSPGGVDWHYMLANHTLLNPTQVLDVAANNGLTGTFTYSLAGQSTFSSLNGNNVTLLDSSSVAVNFGTQDMSFALDTDTLGTLQNATIIDFATFYSGNGALISDVTGVTGTVGGAFVGTEAQGITSTLWIADDGTTTATVDDYYGTMVLAR